jgi:hypothetical protein
MTKSGGFFG